MPENNTYHCIHVNEDMWDFEKLAMKDDYPKDTKPILKLYPFRNVV